MRFDTPLIEGTLLKRYKRFLADVRLPDGKVVVAHVPNSGSMLGVRDPGSPCRVSVSDNPHRKLPHTLQMVRASSGTWVGVNTALTNFLVNEAFEKKIVKDWATFKFARREVKIHKTSRLDFLLTTDDGHGPNSQTTPISRFVEVKNVSMARPPHAVFPDAVTERGQKHLRDLVDLVRQGHEAEIFFVVQRDDCNIFKPCDDIDPEYGKLLRQAAGDGVIVRCWSCKISRDSITIDRELKIDLGGLFFIDVK